MIRPQIKPPSITRKATRTRVFYDRNLTPIGHPNPWYEGPGGGQPDADGNPQWIRQLDHAGYCDALRFRRAFGIYEGTFHRALTWWKGGQFIETDWGRERNNLDPLNNEAVQALNDLVTTANFTEPNDRLLPIFLDIETVTAFHTPDAVIDLASRFKWLLRNSEVWWYLSNIQTDPAQAKSHGALLAQTLSSGVFSFYLWDAVAQSNGKTLWADIRAAKNLIERCFPGWNENKIAAICPVWTINYGGDLASLNGQPVPISLWSELVDFLVEDGWEILFWLTGTKYTAVTQHLNYLAKYAR